MTVLAYAPAGQGPANPLDVLSWTGAIRLPIPDPITFVVSPLWLNRPNLYPRQATLLKIIFLREDLFTDYDYEVVAEWTRNFTQTGNNGIQPDVLDRMRWLKANGYRWFREVLLVMGRRAGKGYVSALAMAYVLWHYMAKGDPHGAYGIDRDKEIQVLIFAGKKEQAKVNLWKDLRNVITGSACFAQYVNKDEAEKLSVFAPYDKARIRKLRQKGIKPGVDMATFHILPKESTVMAARGPASCIQGYDEMAHITNTVAKASAEDVYGSATPSLDQFGKDAFIVEPSSPWQMIGQYYENWKQSLEIDPETNAATYPDKLMLQLTSWDIYEDWEQAAFLPLLPENFAGDLSEYAPPTPVGGDGASMDDYLARPRFIPLVKAVQTYDEDMRRLQRANPETFAVERLSHWATAQDAYLRPDKVDQMFEPWNGRVLVMQERGILAFTYKLHGDPSKSNANFGFAICHTEDEVIEGEDKNGNKVTRTIKHAVFDLIHHFEPSEFDDNIIDYDVIEEWVWDKIEKFYPASASFDQWNSASTIGYLQKKVRAAGLPKPVTVEERTATAPVNWRTFENFKSALNMGWVHAPYYEQADLELKFLVESKGKVEHQTAGPIQTKDVADCVAICVDYLIGEQITAFLSQDLSNVRPTGAVQGGVQPFASQMAPPDDPLAQLRGFSSGRGSTLTGMRRGFRA